MTGAVHIEGAFGPIVEAPRRHREATMNIPYAPTWQSLRQHTTPAWMHNMKFGIYCHWGPGTVQAANRDKELTTLQAIEQWQGENFSAREWASLFESAGAQFAGPVAWHVNGLLNWDSDITDWNSVNHGPKVDISGELAREIRKRDMKLLMSFHSTTLWGRRAKDDPTYLEPSERDSTHAEADNERRSDAHLTGVIERMEEAIDIYRPDMVWVDVGFGGTVRGELRGNYLNGRLLEDGDLDAPGIRECFQRRLISHYFNSGVEWGKEVEFIYKSFDIPPGIGMRDIENGSLQGLQHDPWIADIDITQHCVYPYTWFYDTLNPFKETQMLIHSLVDMVSKNGRMLLNVPPMADGTFSDEGRRALLRIGEWLKINGEAIYDTHPWALFGEGPTEIRVPGHHAQGRRRGADITRFTARDIRFTRNEEALYAICLGWPGTELRIRALGHRGKLYPDDILSVSMLGTDELIPWKHTGEALTVKLPKEPPCDYAYTLKIKLR